VRKKRKRGTIRSPLLISLREIHIDLQTMTPMNRSEQMTTHAAWDPAYPKPANTQVVAHAAPAPAQPILAMAIVASAVAIAPSKTDLAFEFAVT